MMHLGIPLQSHIGNNISRFKAAGVGVATLAAIQRFPGEGTLAGEGIGTLMGVLGHVATLATATGEGYIDTPLFNQHMGIFNTVTGEGIDDSSIGVGTIITETETEEESTDYAVVWIDE
jgi:hypothetical protein